MSLDIHIRRTNSRGVAAPALSFEDDGYYWFLHPLFERLREQSGKYIDLYGDAFFTRDDLPRLRTLLSEAESMARRQPLTWEVHVGTQSHPVKKELYRTVNREDLLKLIFAFRGLVEAADENDAQIECIGD